MGRSRQGGTGGAASASDGSEARASNVVAYLVQGLAGFHGIVINSDDLPPSDGAENKHIRVVETPADGVSNNTRAEDRRADGSGGHEQASTGAPFPISI